MASNSGEELQLERCIMWCIDRKKGTLSNRDGVVIYVEVDVSGELLQKLEAPFYCSELKKNKILLETRHLCLHHVF